MENLSRATAIVADVVPGRSKVVHRRVSHNAAGWRAAMERVGSHGEREGDAPGRVGGELALAGRALEFVGA